MILPFLLLFFSFSFSQAPAWLAPPAAPPPASPAAAAVVKPDTVVVSKVRIRTVKDTVILVDTLRIVQKDTVRDTVISFPVQYKYVVRYALTSLNVEMSNPEWLDYASVNEIIARDTATLKIGSEQIRTLGATIDGFGNHIPQTDIITTGFTINIFGNRATIEYRGKNSVAFFAGSFDNSGFLFANGEIAETGFLAGFFPFNLFFGSSKKRIIIEIFREAYL
jgi:hypothetical protein